MSTLKPQRTQQQLPRLKPMNPNRQAKQPTPPPNGNVVLHLLQKHALLLFVALWAGLLGVAFSAGKSLIYSDLRSESSSTQASTSEYEAPDIQDAGKLPVFLFGAIALTCVAGSWIILQQLHDAKPRRPLRRPRPRPRPHARPIAASDQRQQPIQLPRREIPAWGGQKPASDRRPSPIKPLVPNDPEK